MAKNSPHKPLSVTPVTGAPFLTISEAAKEALAANDPKPPKPEWAIELDLSGGVPTTAMPVNDPGYGILWGPTPMKPAIPAKPMPFTKYFYGHLPYKVIYGKGPKNFHEPAKKPLRTKRLPWPTLRSTRIRSARRSFAVNCKTGHRTAEAIWRPRGVAMALKPVVCS